MQTNAFTIAQETLTRVFEKAWQPVYKEVENGLQISFTYFRNPKNSGQIVIFLGLQTRAGLRGFRLGSFITQEIA
jgi:hypothetical protein